MPRRRDDEDERDDNSGEYERPAKKGSLLWLWLLLGIGGAFALVGVVVAVGLAGWLMAKVPPAGPNAVAPPQQAKRQYTRDEFKARVVGKTEAEVIAAVGKPSQTSDSGATRYWYYEEVTTDPATGKIDYRAQLVIERGKVTGVSY